MDFLFDIIPNDIIKYVLNRYYTYYVKKYTFKLKNQFNYADWKKIMYDSINEVIYIPDDQNNFLKYDIISQKKEYNCELLKNLNIKFPEKINVKYLIPIKIMNNFMIFRTIISIYPFKQFIFLLKLSPNTSALFNNSVGIETDYNVIYMDDNYIYTLQIIERSLKLSITRDLLKFKSIKVQKYDIYNNYFDVNTSKDYIYIICRNVYNRLQIIIYLKESLREICRYKMYFKISEYYIENDILYLIKYNSEKLFMYNALTSEKLYILNSKKPIVSLRENSLFCKDNDNLTVYTFNKN